MPLRWYQMQLARKPLRTQCLTTATLFAAGDVIAQQAVDGKGTKHEFSRTARMAFYGGCIFGPIATQWFRFLDKSIRIPSSKNAEIVARVAADQLFFAPTNLGLFLTTMSLLEGGDPKQKLKDAYWTGLAKNWTVWPVVQLVNFKLVPLDHRLLVVNVVSLGWNSYLSYLNTQKSGSQVVREIKEEL